MFTPIPHTQLEDNSGLTGWPRFLLVDASEIDAWFVARVIVGRDLSCHTMLFANAQVMIAVMDGPEYKRIVDLVMVSVQSLKVVTHRVLRLWGSTTVSDMGLVVESIDGSHFASDTGTQMAPRADFSVLLDLSMYAAR